MPMVHARRSDRSQMLARRLSLSLIGALVIIVLAAGPAAAAKTSLVKDIAPGSDGSGPDGLARFGDRVLFRAWREATGTELWKTQGTATSTRLVKSATTVGVAHARAQHADAASGNSRELVERRPSLREARTARATPRRTPRIASRSLKVTGCAPCVPCVTRGEG